MTRSEALIQLRINQNLLTHKLVKLRQLQEELHSNTDSALSLHMEVERYLTIHEKAKE